MIPTQQLCEIFADRHYNEAIAHTQPLLDKKTDGQDKFLSFQCLQEQSEGYLRKNLYQNTQTGVEVQAAY
ncbi:hypothetical protein CSA56_08945 [candidate division KSB3 bacterium]|uniref:Uncharacterized protein n=1 Tax=candidate division KSB3 bacterium TaxID=2044937 RepID=A0A2G6KEB9_9BACT|nr:MAG: hypothetical protein CSA56_08945 [candidate division KSB3 bacterium]